MNKGSKLAVSGNVSLAEVLEGEALGITVTILDKATGEAATLKNGEVIATIKGEGYANITLDQTAHEGVSLEYNKGKLVVTGAPEEAKPKVDQWVYNADGTITYKSNSTGAAPSKDGYPKAEIDLDKYLAGGNRADIKSISMKIVATGNMNGCLGANQGKEIPASWDPSQMTQWVQTGYSSSNSDITLAVEEGLGEGKAEVQIWWSETGVPFEITISDITVNY